VKIVMNSQGMSHGVPLVCQVHLQYMRLQYVRNSSCMPVTPGAHRVEERVLEAQLVEVPAAQNARRQHRVRHHHRLAGGARRVSAAQRNGG